MEYMLLRFAVKGAIPQRVRYWRDRTCEARDLEGHHWWFMQRLRT